MLQWFAVGFAVVVALIVTCRHIARGLKGECACSSIDCSACSGTEMRGSGEDCRCGGNNEA